MRPVLVGVPGFEPGASRSRNLGGFVHRDRFRGFLDRFKGWRAAFELILSTEMGQITT